MDGRTPKNLQELLRYAIKVQQADNSSSNRVPCESMQLDDDRKQFLNQVLQTMTVDVMEEFLNAINVLQDESSDELHKLDSLETIRDYIGNIDFSNSLIKLKDADIIIKCARDPNPDISVSAINVVAEMSQNNVTCQIYFVERGLVELLTSYLNDEDPELVASAMYGLAALTQHFEPGLIEFLKNDGVKLVVNCLSSTCRRVLFKIYSLISSLSSENNLVKDEFAKLNVFNNLWKKIRVVDKFDMETEMILDVMSVLIGSRYCNPNKEEIMYISVILTNIIKAVDQFPECEETIQFAKSILTNLESKK